jgi:hypothetical protein
MDGPRHPAMPDACSRSRSGSCSFPMDSGAERAGSGCGRDSGAAAQPKATLTSSNYCFAGEINCAPLPRRNLPRVPPRRLREFVRAARRVLDSDRVTAAGAVSAAPLRSRRYWRRESGAARFGTRTTSAHRIRGHQFPLLHFGYGFIRSLSSQASLTSCSGSRDCRGGGGCTCSWTSRTPHPCAAMTLFRAQPQEHIALAKHPDGRVQDRGVRGRQGRGGEMGAAEAAEPLVRRAVQRVRGDQVFQWSASTASR